MIKTILIILTTVSVITACGGDSPDSGSQTNTDKPPMGSNTKDEEQDLTIVIDTYNEEHIVSPKINQDIKITGSNNIVTINLPPNIVTITGNDNTIKIENRAKVLNIGNGNIVLNLNGSVSNLN